MAHQQASKFCKVSRPIIAVAGDFGKQKSLISRAWSMGCGLFRADDVIAQDVSSVLEKFSADNGLRESVFYYDFPIFGDAITHPLKNHMLFVSKSTGVILIAAVDLAYESSEELVHQIASGLDELDTHLYSKLLRSPRLRSDKRSLKVPLYSCLYVLNYSESDVNGVPCVTSDAALRELLESRLVHPIEDSDWEELLAHVEGGKGIRRQDAFDAAEAYASTKVRVLSAINKRITNFDHEQRNAALSIVRGPQRIRGLAGSGKTIVLAMKAAHLHLRYPKANILFTFWTKSLYASIKQQITRFYRQFEDGDPDWDNLHIRHAWGGRDVEGVYYNACIDSGVAPMSLRSVSAKAGESKFDKVCSLLLERKCVVAKYDYVLIDEGQDLPSSFYQLCFDLTFGEEKDRNIVWAYDDLQTIMDVEPQDPHKTFGSIEGTEVAKIDLQRAAAAISKNQIPHDIVLKKCYRNPAQILVVAHALGFGLYSDQIVQMLEQGAEHWEDLGYKIVEGSCNKGSLVKIERPRENSPIDFRDFEDAGECIAAFQAESGSAEVAWVAGEISKVISEGLKPHNILVICLDDRYSRDYFSSLARQLSNNEVAAHNLLSVRYGTPDFFVEGAVTMSTVYRAKGNEAPVVFVMGLDAIFPERKNVRARNKLFTAFTRARGWLYVSGVNNDAAPLLEEIRTAKKKFPVLEFTYPDLTEIRTIQRDWEVKARKLREIQETLDSLDLDGIEEAELEGLIRGRSQKAI